MAYTSIGRIRPNFRGQWSSTAAYDVMDVVYDSTKTKCYQAIASVPAGTVLTSIAHWAMVVDLSGLSGYSPVVSVSKTGTVATVVVTDANGEHRFEINDGEKGDSPIKGVDYTDGVDGDDGVSPTVSVNKVGKVATITITDANGDHTFTVSDGADGSGSGDMSRATYDTNGDGVVDRAEIANNIADSAKDGIAESIYTMLMGGEW